MKINSTVVRTAVLSSTLIALTSFVAPASAASACKGLDNNACNTSAACGWVEGYQRKDGRTVKSFCRTKSTGAKKKSVSATFKTKARKGTKPTK